MLPALLTALLPCYISLRRYYAAADATLIFFHAPEGSSHAARYACILPCCKATLPMFRLFASRQALPLPDAAAAA